MANTDCSTSTRSASRVASGKERMQLAEVFDRVTGSRTGIEFRGYDGSRSGPLDAPVSVEIRSPRALSYIVQARNDLGLARAYVSGELEVHGDLHHALRRLWRVNDGKVPWRERLRVLRAVGLRALRPVEPPPQEMRARGRRHSKRRDAVAVSHHYDVSNRFYEWLLGPSCAASSGCVRGCACSTWAAAGAAWSCTPRSTTGCRRSA
jgi:cyclopropane-fatty-acyl-phospholipid synthase